MKIELFAGPADGILLEVPDDTVLWIVQSPQMSAAEFLAWEHEDPAARMPEVQQLGYALTAEYSAATLARKFQYVGVKVR